MGHISLEDAHWGIRIVRGFKLEFLNYIANMP